MKMITERARIKSVLERWNKCYPTEKYAPGNDKHRIRLALGTLDLKTVDQDAITAIIGNSSWTNITCDNCGKSVDKAARLGDEPGNDMPSALVCITCLRKAAKELIKS
jgi:hypothetical protein